MSNEPTDHLALLLLDLQDPFLAAIPDADLLLRRTTFALEAARLFGLSVGATEQVPDKLGPTTAAIRSNLPNERAIFPKTTFSGFGAEGLQFWLQSQEIDHLLLAGIETPVCVYQTALEALHEDIGVTVLSDCVGQRRSADRSPVLEQLGRMEAHVLPSETIFYSLLASASDSRFRDFTRLVKAYS